jgi:hypothetical protein
LKDLNSNNYHGENLKTYIFLFIFLNWGIPFGIGTSYGLDGWGSITGKCKIFVFFTASRPALGTPCLPSNGFRAISLGAKRQVREADTHLSLVSWSRVMELYLQSLHIAMVFFYAMLN